MSLDTTPARAPKSRRIEVRTTARQEALLRRAAAAEDRTLTDFVLASAVEEAERVLTDRRWFAAGDAEFDAFVRLLDAPLETTEKLARLWSRPSPFGKSFTPAAR
jgi:uncharacterized protein (DUF1778 family)